MFLLFLPQKVVFSISTLSTFIVLILFVCFLCGSPKLYACLFYLIRNFLINFLAYFFYLLNRRVPYFISHSIEMSFIHSFLLSLSEPKHLLLIYSLLFSLNLFIFRLSMFIQSMPIWFSLGRCTSKSASYLTFFRSVHLIIRISEILFNIYH